MYIPKDYQITEQKQILEFLRNNSFGIIISNGKVLPVTTHLPFIINEKNGELSLITHLAKENPHAKLFEQNKNALIIFNGPHGYISPLWYDNPINVPTWNYAAVHLHGEVECIHADVENLKILTDTILAYDVNYMDRFNSLPKEYIHGMINHITGIRIKITSIEAKFKMSQNKSKADIIGVIENLNKENALNKPLADLIGKMNSLKLK